VAGVSADEEEDGAGVSWRVTDTNDAHLSFTVHTAHTPPPSRGGAGSDADAAGPAAHDDDAGDSEDMGDLEEEVSGAASFERAR
jgi:hypothetical protein